ncbi:MAG: DNA polymerase [Oscillospiraceae bacterium]|nr:DNA polymerase [Oscillospiraceae bacterium]
MHHLYIDLETFSLEPISKTGLYKYAQSPDFQILLFGYSIDGGPVQVLDLTAGACLPPELWNTLRDPSYKKHAYNAAFEWYCLSCWLKLSPRQTCNWLTQWRDTMLHSLYCGYPASLDAAGKALGLPQEKQKLSIGKALIRYFCTPCPPTKSNGNRIRNLPYHDPEKWKLFKTYNAQDVVTEMEIERRLSNFPVPDEVQQQWIMDQIINIRGVAVDMDLVNGALSCGATVRETLTAEAISISGLNNPNSVSQLTQWLREETDEEFEDLRKDTVKDVLARGVRSESATRMLEIRQELSKTSTKKYDAVDTCVCTDGRVRGLLQFYGANRTGREAGRLVQVQNLPQTHLAALDTARDLVKARQLDALKVVYGSVPDTLSQLIRTTFVAAPGMTFIDADFSAIEARVIAWLANEQWVLEVFRSHGKIYEATAAQMFSIPFDRIAKGNPEYEYRKKGKVATLALGYQGGPGALVNMGALRNGLTEEELPDIVERWRRANPSIVQFWYDIESAAWQAVLGGAATTVGKVTVARECDPANNLDFMTIRLPCGRKLYYANPHVGKNRFGRDSLCYYGMNQTSKKWEAVETYGGKLAENITQATARDCLFYAMTSLEASCYRTVFDIHDEVVAEVPEGAASLEKVVEIMSRPIPWAPGLPLNADGWIGEYFRKD